MAAVKPSLSSLPERRDPLWLCEAITSEFERLNELQELLRIAEEYCYWGEEADLKQNLQRVRLLIGSFNLQAEGGIDGLQGFVMNLQAVLLNEPAQDGVEVK